MARINLLPWREAERKRRQTQFVVTLGAAVVATVLVGLAVHIFVEDRIALQDFRNQFLQKEIATLDKQIAEIEELEKAKASLLARMNVIQQLQESRPEIVHLFDELVAGIPDGVHLTKLTQTGRSVVVEGRAQSNARVSAFMRQVEASPWIGNPLLMLIEDKGLRGKDKDKGKEPGLSNFRLRFEQLSVSGKDAESPT